MADGVIADYGAAYGMETEEGEEHGGNDHDEESNETETASTENIRHNDSEMEGSTTMSKGNGTIVNMVHYQSALGLAARTQVLFQRSVEGYGSGKFDRVCGRPGSRP